MAEYVSCQEALPDSMPWIKGWYLGLPRHFIDDPGISKSSLFGRKRFENITDEDCTILNPSQLMPFWYALFGPSCRRKIRHSSIHRFYDRHMYHIDLSQEGQMDACISIRFTPINTYGITEPCASRPGLLNYPSMQDVLREYHLLSTIPNLTPSLFDDPTQPYTTTASILCTRFHLAKTLLHELCYAVKWATPAPQPTGLFPNSPSPSSTTGNLPSQTKPGERPHRLAPPFEPFFAHHCVAELGCAWEQLTSHGWIHPLCSSPPARWGLTLEKWPNAWFAHGKPERGTRACKPWSTKYAISTAWAAALWREGFWSGVERFGGRELWPEWVLGVRERREETKWGEGDRKERRDRKAVARANRLRIEGRKESEEDSEDGDSSEGKLYDKEGVGGGGLGEEEEMEVDDVQ
ncbi:hypothetical protein V2W45_1470580 [Cenococcum geophilum]